MEVNDNKIFSYLKSRKEHTNILSKLYEKNVKPDRDLDLKEIELDKERWFLQEQLTHPGLNIELFIEHSLNAIRNLKVEELNLYVFTMSGLVANRYAKEEDNAVLYDEFVRVYTTSEYNKGHYRSFPV